MSNQPGSARKIGQDRVDDGIELRECHHAGFQGNRQGQLTAERFGGKDGFQGFKRRLFEEREVTDDKNGGSVQNKAERRKRSVSVTTAEEVMGVN